MRLLSAAGLAAGPDQLLKEAPVGTVLFAQPLFHAEQQSRAGERNGDSVDNLGFDASGGVLKANAASVGHQVDGDVVVDPHHDPFGDVLVTQFADRAVWEDLQGAFDERLVGAVPGDEQVDTSVARTNPSRLIAKPPMTT